MFDMPPSTAAAAATVAILVISTVVILFRRRQNKGAAPDDRNHKFSDKYAFNGNKAGDNKLGEGAFSTVFLASLKRDPRQHVAVKRIRRTPDLKEEDIAMLRSEAEILQSVNHPNIIQLFGLYEEKDVFYMVLEYVAGGELFDRIVAKTFYSEKEARDTVRALLDVLAYLHSHGLAHRDLKPENLLLASANDDTAIKLCDFGFAHRVEGGHNLSTQCGTPGYVAPEIILGHKYGVEVDMWSCGVIVYILLGGYPPFHDENQTELYRAIRSACFVFDEDYWGHVSADAKDLICKMIVVDQDARLTAKQAMLHPWLLAGDHELVSRSLERSLTAMKAFNAKRKLKGAVKTVMMTNQLKKVMLSNMVDGE